MLRRIIEWSVDNKFLILLFALFAVAGGMIAVSRTPLEAIPDLSDVQVIVQADYPGQAPMIVEDQVTYPIAAEMLKVPGARVVRGYSFFGLSFVYVIFEDGTDIYWARSRVLEYLSAIQDQLPDGARASLGPDATGLGWVFQYVLEDTLGNHSLADLRAIQDWNLRYALTAVPGVSEVAAVGGYERMYEITVDPAKLRGYEIPVSAVMQAVRVSNQDEGAMMLDLSEREFMVRALGYFQGIEDIENVVVGAANGTPIRVADIGTVQFAPDVRRGAADFNGRGEVVGGIVVMRFGENALAVIDRVKDKIEEVQASLPEGVVIHTVYDRSDLIRRAIKTLQEKLIEEFIVVALVCLIFLWHARSALVAILTLPIGILMGFMAMRIIGINADIMSLGGIAIAIGAMVDAAIVMIENNHKHLERAAKAHYAERGEEIPKKGFHTSIFSARERWQMVIASSKEVGPALFFALLIITVSFLPVFALEAQEGRLFKPLAWTKTLAMAAGPVQSDEIGRPQGLYREHCAHCHGITGDGAGPTSLFLDPYPRDFRMGAFKFKSTPIGRKPTYDDLHQIMIEGIPGTAMPSFRLLPEDELEALIQYVIYLSMRGEVERALIFESVNELDPDERLLDVELQREDPDTFRMQADFIRAIAADVINSWLDADNHVVPVPPRPTGMDLEESIIRGRELYYGTVANCFTCHGDGALGDGQTDDYDDWTKDWTTAIGIDPQDREEVREFLALRA
jgi:mono/diheme cytochrome c family protein